MPRHPRHRHRHRPSESHAAHPLPGLAAGFLGALAAAALAWQAGGGLLLAFLAYGLGGSLALTATLLTQAARPLRPRLARALAAARRPVALFSH